MFKDIDVPDDVSEIMSEMPTELPGEDAGSDRGDMRYSECLSSLPKDHLEMFAPVGFVGTKPEPKAMQALKFNDLKSRQKLGVGKFGPLLRAKLCHQPVFVKILADDDYTRRFMREAQFLVSSIRKGCRSDN